MKKSKTVKQLEKILDEEFSFAMAVRAYRTREGLTQEELANKLGVKKSYISNIENQRDFITLEQAIRFAKAFKEPESLWMTYALQDMVDRTGRNLKVKLVA